uniref:Ig-like domain-containing protein n=1 Tax=Sinocyclocheilus anshuiensis TaxID=1608454 RepID=A0A671Q6P3_9TELE
MTADQIWPNKDAVVIKEDETVALSCSYTSSGYVYWYRQYPNKELQYLIYSAQSSSGRFRMTKSQTSTELTITGVTLSDSALYYCALRVGAQ